MNFSGSDKAFGQNVTSNQTWMAQEENKKLLYNKDLNPRKKEYYAILGFNDLHIKAINHINPNMTTENNPDAVKRIVYRK